MVAIGIDLKQHTVVDGGKITVVTSNDPGQGRSSYVAFTDAILTIEICAKNQASMILKIQYTTQTTNWP